MAASGHPQFPPPPGPLPALPTASAAPAAPAVPAKPAPPARQRYMPPYNHYELMQKMSTGGDKAFGGLLGDSAALTWIFGLLILAVATCVVVFSQSFLQAYAKARHEAQDYDIGYYACQYSLALAIVTLVFDLLYVGWVWADAPHPMRKAWQASSSAAENANKATFGGTKNAAGDAVNRPGMGTQKLWSINRLTVSRVFAEKQHIYRLRWAQLAFFLAWLIPFLLMTFKDGYLTWKRAPGQHSVQVVQVCGEKRTHDTCMELAKAGICSGVLAAFFLLAVVACTVALTAKKTPRP